MNSAISPAACSFISEDSARFSHDFDIFHEAAEDVARASDADTATLRAAGFEVSPAVGNWSQPAEFRKARVIRGVRFGAAFAR